MGGDGCEKQAEGDEEVLWTCGFAAEGRRGRGGRDFGVEPLPALLLCLSAEDSDDSSPLFEPMTDGAHARICLLYTSRCV